MKAYGRDNEGGEFVVEILRMGKDEDRNGLDNLETVY
jgi:hypothetical protein